MSCIYLCWVSRCAPLELGYMLSVFGLLDVEFRLVRSSGSICKHVKFNDTHNQVMSKLLVLTDSDR